MIFEQEFISLLQKHGIGTSAIVSRLRRSALSRPARLPTALPWATLLSRLTALGP